MPEEQIETDVDQNESQDPTNNLKHEFSRKIQNLQETNSKLEEQNSALNQKLDMLLETVSKQQVPQQSQSSNIDWEDLKYSDPDKYVELKQQEFEQKIETKLNQRDEVANRKQQVLSQLASDYPEINDANSELYKRALDIGKQYDKQFITTPEGIQLAVREAAAQLGVIPSHKRQRGEEEEDMAEFIGSGGSGSGKNRKSKKSKEDELDPKSIVVAELMGLDTKDEKVMNRLKERNKRKQWTRWE